VASAEARITPPASQLLATALRAAASAADIIRAGAANLPTLHWDVKGPSDFVSNIDRAAEQSIRDTLLAAFPGARILGEEFSPDMVVDPALSSESAGVLGPAGAGVLFVVDPLDGTTNFLHGYPEYAVSIGVLVDSVLTAAVVKNAANGETFTATRGGGAFRDGTPIHVSTITNPDRSLIGTGFPFSHIDRLDDYLPQFAAVAKATAGMRRAGAAALDLCDVACGRFEAFWELVLAPWDIAAGLLIVREAGGIVTTLEGHDAPVAHTPVVAGNPPMHAWLLDTLNRAL
jgi:myo-inositol-1(or 4)-monophosphatase